jgi:hypothetical protein
MIIGLSGWARAGKDSVAGILVDHHGYRRVAFADKLRDVALAVNPVVDATCRDVTQGGPVYLSELVDALGWDEAKVAHYEVRRILQTLGGAVRDHVDRWAWVKAALRDVDVDENVVISDVRYRNEARAITARGGLVVRVRRPGVEAVNGHASEHDLDYWPFDHVIDNNGTLDDLADVVDVVVAARAS